MKFCMMFDLITKKECDTDTAKDFFRLRATSNKQTQPSRMVERSGRLPSTDVIGAWTLYWVFNPIELGYSGQISIAGFFGCIKTTLGLLGLFRTPPRDPMWNIGQDFMGISAGRMTYNQSIEIPQMRSMLLEELPTFHWVMLLGFLCR